MNPIKIKEKNENLQENRWVANKFGVINFWYYDMEEFALSRGKIIFRGNNGSGKSVTMQSFVPFLLDGNKSPERLDPFGSKARKMENYLLDENTDEKTAYLYIEFKRAHSEHYLTLGIGMKAVKGKPMDSWYFIIDDGRRVGIDLQLYRNTGENIALTKKQLQNEVGTGGFFTEKQGTYMQKVNEYLFGFDELENYEELVDLLIQLRSPKLSKDFKPTKIYEILTDSLRILSEDDLRPMTESMEHMDTLQNTQDEIKRALQATKNINYHYERYNQYCLYEKAKGVVEQHKEVKGIEREIEEEKKKEAQNRKQIMQLTNEIEVLQAELKEAEMTYDSLEKSDVLQLQKQLQEDKARLSEYIQKIKELEKEEEKNRVRVTELQYQLKSMGQELEGIASDIDKQVEELEEVAEDANFEEGIYFCREFDGEQEGVSYDHIEMSVGKYNQKIKEGIQALKEFEKKKETLQRIQKESDQKQEQLELSQRELERRNQLVGEVREELKEKYIRWKDSNAYLVYTPKQIQEILKKINQVEHSTEVSGVEEKLIPVYHEIQSKQMHLKEGKKIELQSNAEKIKIAKEELLDLQNQKEVEFPREKGVIENRKRIAEQGIPYIPLYKAIEFKKEVPEEIKISIESALMEMGLLDALILPSNQQGKLFFGEQMDFVMNHGENQSITSHDRYLHTQPNMMGFNLTQYLQVEKGELQGISELRVLEVLESIFLDEGSLAYIDEKGNYGIGPLKGKANLDYEPQYIGVTSRKRAMLQLIESKKAEIQNLENLQISLEKEFKDVQLSLEILKQEYGKRPAVKDFSEAIRLVEHSIDEVQKIEKEATSALDVLFAQTEKVKEENKKVFRQLQGMTLHPTVEKFEEARDSLLEFSKRISHLARLYSSYQDKKKMMSNHQESLEEKEEEKDRILYELVQTQQKKKNIEGKIKTIEETLIVKDVEGIQQKLTYCLEVKEKHPSVIYDKNNAKGRCENNLENIRKYIEKENQRWSVEIQKQEAWEETLRREAQLQYVHPYSGEEMYPYAKYILENYDMGEEVGRDTYFTKLMESFNKNDGDLRDYGVKGKEVLQIDGEEQEELRRIYQKSSRYDFICRIGGKNISFHHLQAEITTHLEEIKLLVQEEERKIFEEILLNTISSKIRSKIYLSKQWVDKINELMESMDTSSSLALSLKWVPKKAESEGDLDITELVKIMERNEITQESDLQKLSLHFGNKVKSAIRAYEGSGEARNYQAMIRDVLDYRKWYEFKLYFMKEGERKKELTNNDFDQFSGGEKAMSMYVPLFSAVYARYDNAKSDCPRIIAMDEAFAGVDENNIRDMFRLLKELHLDYVLNSQILWGDYDTVESLSICELIRDKNDDIVTVIPYHWNGIERQCLI